MAGTISASDGAVQSVGTQQRFCSLEHLGRKHRVLVLVMKKGQSDNTKLDLHGVGSPE